MEDYSGEMFTGMVWGYYIDCRLPLKEQLEIANQRIKTLRCLILLEEQGAIEILNLEDSSSKIRWRVLDEEAYRKVQAKCSLPFNWGAVLKGKTEEEVAELFDELSKRRDTHRKERLE